MPAHFIIKRTTPGGDLFVDPFGAGRVHSREGCRALIARILGPTIHVPDEQFAPVSKRAILIRMLNNLRMIYLQAGQWRPAAHVLLRLRTLLPDDEAYTDELQFLVGRLAQLN